MYLTKHFFGKVINKLLADASLIDCILITVFKCFIRNMSKLFIVEYH